MTSQWIVVTTINPPTEAIVKLSALANKGWNVVVVGDKKTPKNWKYENITYLSVNKQQELFGELASATPHNHYCRKNLGYLYAMMNGANCILETDDDNIPYFEFGLNISERQRIRLVSGARWINVYKYFTPETIWPRGIPLDEMHTFGEVGVTELEYDYPIQQYLADKDPDVDAIYRLTMNKDVTFEKGISIGLEKESWVPFNSQNTVFFNSAFPLLYLPCHTSFRMTDIWRSFVAQKTLWYFDKRVAFHSPTVKQMRNEHDLMHDFIEEIPGYINNKKITELLDQCIDTIIKPIAINDVVRLLWAKLCDAGIIPEKELVIYDLWATFLKQNSSTEKINF